MIVIQLELAAISLEAGAMAKLIQAAAGELTLPRPA